MMLILSTCSHKLSEDEFVAPIKKIVDNTGLEYDIRRYDESFDYSQYDRIIICGTALKDFGYMADREKLSWIREYRDKMLGICSGAQMIAAAFGCGLEQRVMIGKSEVEVARRNKIASGKFESYFLTTQKIMLNDQFIRLDGDGYMFRHKRRYVYGVLFHPEVLNKKIIENFSSI